MCRPLLLPVPRPAMNATARPAYEMVIGLEIHARLATATKLFCSCPNSIYDEHGQPLPPNVHACPVCMGFPGALPVPNAHAIELATRAATALHCRVDRESKFDRKSYFYPDLPAGYQISQYDQPVGQHGSVQIIVGDEARTIGITRIHLENDAGKLTHTTKDSLADYNRAGAPLVETVTEPDFRSKEEVMAFLEEFRQILRYTGVGTADMEKGEMRCDVNISIRPWGQEKYGTKVELKNMNSISAVGRAIDDEYARQVAAIEAGEEIRQETRGWDDDARESSVQRVKEAADDYRYFPEPDIPNIILEKEYVDAQRALVPELPTPARLRLQAAGMRPADALLLTSERSLLALYDAAIAAGSEPQRTANLLLSTLLALVGAGKTTLDTHQLQPSELARATQLAADGTISGTNAKLLVEELALHGGTADAVVDKHGMRQSSDTGLIDQLCQEAIAELPAAAADVRGGNAKAMGAIVGLVMKKSQGKANPALVSARVTELLK